MEHNICQLRQRSVVGRLVKLFIFEYYEKNNENRILFKVLYQHYKEWCNFRFNKILPQNSFGKEIGKEFEKKRMSYGIIVLGIKLKPKNELVHNGDSNFIEFINKINKYVLLFLHIFCERSEYGVAIKRLYKYYEEWCEIRSILKLDKILFGIEIGKKFEMKRGTEGIVVLGISIKSPHSIDQTIDLPFDRGNIDLFSDHGNIDLFSYHENIDIPSDHENIDIPSDREQIQDHENIDIPSDLEQIQNHGINNFLNINVVEKSHIYVISNKNGEMNDEYKIGYHGGPQCALIKRYKTSLIDPNICLYYSGTRYDELIILRMFRDYRIKSETGKLTEWVRLPLSKILKIMIEYFDEKVIF